jgi:hypothetical protein
VVTKLGPLRKVKLLKNKADKAVVRSPEKAGVGGSTPSLATMFSIGWKKFINFYVNAKHSHLGLTAAQSLLDLV